MQIVRIDRLSLGAGVAALAFVTGGALAPSAGARSGAGAPAVAYWKATGGDVAAVVADAAGGAIRSYPDFSKMSLNGGVLAGELPGKKHGADRVVAYDAATGERLFRIPDARLPVVLDGGRKVAFSPTHRRDEMARSVWMRTAPGRLRKIAKFADRRHSGIRHGMRAGAVPLDMAFDDSGRYMALVGGLETVRSFDVWIVDVKTKEATRITRGENSHNPSVSPDGSRVAVRVERPEGCPDPILGEYLIGKIRVFSRVTGEHETLTEWSCDLFYDTPRWIDDDTLLAVRATADDSASYGFDLDVVEIDVTSGEITALVTDGNPCCITASPALRKVAYGFSDRDAAAMLDVDSGTEVDFGPGTFVPHLSGDNRF